jgi:demethylmenaquinone methyltransferase/2-methoxy-6-polyprenyl-1,4-benzoquinol methylase
MSRKTDTMRKSDTPAMFSLIARKYDLLNHLFSLHIDRLWRKQLFSLSEIPDGGAVLDACTGTGDVALVFGRSRRVSTVVGVDLSTGMLDVAAAKARKKSLDGKVRFMQADVLNLPFEDGTFDAVTISFGVRNLQDYDKGMAEMTRVLKPGGRVLILEFAPPTRDLYLKGYNFYLKKIIPAVGGFISGNDVAYKYLATSVDGFLPRERMLELLCRAGLESLCVKKLAGGVAYIYRGEKSSRAGAGPVADCPE